MCIRDRYRSQQNHSIPPEKKREKALFHRAEPDRYFSVHGEAAVLRRLPEDVQQRLPMQASFFPSHRAIRGSNA